MYMYMYISSAMHASLYISIPLHIDVSPLPAGNTKCTCSCIVTVALASRHKLYSTEQRVDYGSACSLSIAFNIHHVYKSLTWDLLPKVAYCVPWNVYMCI